MNDRKVSVAEMLRDVYRGPGCTPMTIARTVGLEEPRCRERGCDVCLRRMLSALADMMDAEVAEAREASARDGMAVIAAAEGWPALRDGESVTEWMGRCWLPWPRYDDGEPVEVGGRADGLESDIQCIGVSVGSANEPWYTLFDDADQIEGSGPFTRRAHIPSDTREAIDDDASMTPAAYCAARGIDLGDDPDRETATAAMVADLLRRQRELDARKGGDA